MKVNRALLWDMDWKPEDYATERFRRWYIARVLSTGTGDDIRALDEAFYDIPRLLPELRIPRTVRTYWEWVLKESRHVFEHPFAGATRTARPA